MSNTTVQKIEYDPVLEAGFSHIHNQSNERKLIETGRGDCFAYAKYRLFSQPWLGLFARYDAASGIHFGAVDFDDGLVVYHLISDVRAQRLLADDELVERVVGGQTITTASRGADNVYSVNKENQSTSALFYNSFDWSRVFQHIQANFDGVNPWNSTLTALNNLDG